MIRAFKLIFLLGLILFSCKNQTQEVQNDYKSPIVTTPIERNPVTKDSSDFREFRILDSKYIDKELLWKPFEAALKSFSEDTYEALKPYVLEQDIPTLQKYIANGDLSYEKLVTFYLYRIKKFDRENEWSLNSVISLNPKVIEQAKQKDNELKNRMQKHPIFGMPILLKDNVNAADMPTTAGAFALHNNTAEDASIVKRLKERGALILGKANLSEWAYFFCGDCPSGYSAIGGQTLNPYGRRLMDTGGSSSGSGVAVSANFCAAAIGSETSGSILSPSSANSIVGIKPTIGMVSRSGIVPISSTLDTAGPMTKNVIDAAILLSVIAFEDAKDAKTVNLAPYEEVNYYTGIEEANASGKRLGVFKGLLENTLYADAVATLKTKGVEIIEVETINVDLQGFLSLLNLDMRKDLPGYLSTYASDSITVASVNDVISFNQKDSLHRAPYGQALFKGIVNDKGTEQTLDSIKTKLKTNGRLYFDTLTKEHQLDGFLSINNYHAGYAAVAEYPAITVPMGYNDNGVPMGLTFISKPLSEKSLLQWAYFYEKASKKRIAPSNYN